MFVSGAYPRGAGSAPLGKNAPEHSLCRAAQRRQFIQGWSGI